MQEVNEDILQMFIASLWVVPSLRLADEHEHQHKQIHLKVTALKQHRTGKLEGLFLIHPCLD